MRLHQKILNRQRKFKCALIILVIALSRVAWTADAENPNVGRALKEAIDSFWDASPKAVVRRYESLKQYRHLARQDPAAARKHLQSLRARVDEFDENSARVAAFDFVRIVCESPPEVAFEFLDAIYKKFSTQDDAALRQFIFNEAISLLHEAREQTLLTFKRWLLMETDAEVKSHGFGAFARFARAWDVELAESLKGKIPQEEIDLAQRMVRLNALKDHGDLYRELSVWLNEYIFQLESSEPVVPTPSMLRLQENTRIFVASKLFSLPSSVLGEHSQQIKQFHQRCENLRKQAEIRCDDAVNAEERNKWFRRKGAIDDLSRALDGVLKKMKESQ